jgi:flavorubredoxin
MNAIIVIHSQSGHTALFGRTIAEKLREKGCEVDIELLRTTKFVKPSARNIEFKRIPDPSPYDLILVGGPVWGFTMSPVTLAYLDEVKSLKTKRGAAFSTYFLPFDALGGGARSLAEANSNLELLGADTVEGERLFWLFAVNRRRMHEAAGRLAARLTAD